MDIKLRVVSIVETPVLGAAGGSITLVTMRLDKKDNPEIFALQKSPQGQEIPRELSFFVPQQEGEKYNTGDMVVLRHQKRHAGAAVVISRDRDEATRRICELLERDPEVPQNARSFAVRKVPEIAGAFGITLQNAHGITLGKEIRTTEVNGLSPDEVQELRDKCFELMQTM